eukprot:CAMPEP_0175137968 /NCGR_PEP_ID=MMETSP0087-20121206/10092_1 /TAXON_ID=136419 /ORGANISM="Unknown Unknown, Strain D1" /LENGTH=579 /DNA_ID=CAMNT_0016420827 /DNA_START=115 /DNA_END=1854 /DNA_ORIENTATION=-
MPKVVTLLDYGAGNVRSVRNAIRKAGFEINDVKTPQDISSAESLVFPGVGSFKSCMQTLQDKGYAEPLTKHIRAGKPFFGICLGMQVLFESSEEGECKGLGIIPGHVQHFPPGELAVPHIGWNELNIVQKDGVLDSSFEGKRFYFVHSFRAALTAENLEWALAVTDYGQRFISAVQKGAVMATQFHPEKSAQNGIALLKRFLSGQYHTHTSNAVTEEAKQISSSSSSSSSCVSIETVNSLPATVLAKRVIACLDVRSNDDGDLVVTKGDQYDCREESTEGGQKGVIRNLGKPVELANRYYEEGADEITFLNITSFRSCPLTDMPLLEVLEQASVHVFVPLTIGGGIRAFTDENGRHYSALDVADRYFRSGADKVSIGSDAVSEAIRYIANGRKKQGDTSIELISQQYGVQAVVVSIDPRRVWVADDNDNDNTDTATATGSASSCPHPTITSTLATGPNGEARCWYQCTVKGGREGRDVSAVELARAVEELGAGEILLNCIDADGTKAGFDTDLIKHVKSAVTIPVIASSGAGSAQHFVDVFSVTNADAALAAGIFHRREVPIQEVKSALSQAHIRVRQP